MMTCSLVDEYHHFGQTCCLHLQDKSVLMNQFTWHSIPRYSYLHNHSCENLNPHGVHYFIITNHQHYNLVDDTIAGKNGICKNCNRIEYGNQLFKFKYNEEPHTVEIYSLTWKLIHAINDKWFCTRLKATH
jgi:hypothetical protein